MPIAPAAWRSIGQQHTEDRTGNREADPGHGTVDFRRCFATRAAKAVRAGRTAHQHHRIDLEHGATPMPRQKNWVSPMSGYFDCTKECTS